MKIITVNAHSVLNSGDTAIILSQLDWFDASFEKNQHILVSRTPRLDRSLYRDRVNDILIPFLPAPSIFQGNMERWMKSITHMFGYQDKFKLMRALKHCDLVISSGGGYFWTHRKYFPGPMFFQNYLSVKLAEMAGKPVIFFPQSFGPLHNRTAQKMLASLLTNQNVVKIFPREKFSHTLVHTLTAENGIENKIELCPDMAFLFTPGPAVPPESKPNRKGPLIALTLRRWDFPETASKSSKKEHLESYIHSLLSGCRRLYRSHNASFIVFPQSRGPGAFENDRSISIDFSKKLGELIPENHIRYIELPDNASPHQVIQLLSKADCAVTTRFHSAVFALIAGVPAVPIVYQPKARGIMDMLGMEHFSLDIHSLSADGIVRIVEHALDNQGAIKRKLTSQLISIRKAIRRKLDGTMKGLNLR